MPESTDTLVAIGGYTDADAPTPDGLTTWWWDGATGIEPAGSAQLPSPSFVCWHPRMQVLYAVSELDAGTVTALRVADDGVLAPAITIATGGSLPCWVTTDPGGHALLIANYGSGSATVVELDDAGLPTGRPRIVPHRGSGPVAGRQDGPHVHQLVPTADGFVLATDLGTDRIAEYRIDPGPGGDTGEDTVTEVGSIAMPAGSGPRHIALAADGRTGFVSGELDATVTTIRRDTEADGRWAAVGQVPCSGRPGAQPSHLQLAGGGRWLLVANRGTDTLAVLDVADGLRIGHEVPTGRTPRYFVADGHRVLVACQGSGTVSLLTLDETDGSLTPVGALSSGGAAATVPAPSCVALRR